MLKMIMSVKLLSELSGSCVRDEKLKKLVPLAIMDSAV